MRSANGAFGNLTFFSIGNGAGGFSSLCSSASSLSRGRFVVFRGVGVFGSILTGWKFESSFVIGDDVGSALKLLLRFAVDVKKSIALDGRELLPPLACVAGGEGSSRYASQPESICEFISTSLTGFSQIGHATMDVIKFVEQGNAATRRSTEDASIGDK
jgi:hypothetical protein